MDSITHGGVQYNDGVSAFSARKPVEMGIGSGSAEMRRIQNVSLQAGTTVTSDGSRQLINEADGDGQTKKISTTASLSGSADYGVSSTRIDFADVNGDGLVDHVREDPDEGSMRVRLNLGYGFSKEVTWPRAGTSGWSQANATVTAGWSGLLDWVPDPASVLNQVPANSPASTNVVRLQDTGTLSAAVGVSLGFIGGGGGPTYSVTRTWVDLMDVNGDGLPDQVLKIPGDPQLRVKLNQGDGFLGEQSWSLPNWQTSPGSTFSFLSPDGLAYSTIDGWGKNFNFQVCWFLCVGASGFQSDSLGGTSMQFEDVDGDGDLDQVMKVPGNANVYVKFNNVVKAARTTSDPMERIGPPNLLTAVIRPLGSRFDITYGRAGNRVDLNAAVNMPSNQWVMTNVVLNSDTRQSCPQGPSDKCITQNLDYKNPWQNNDVQGFYDIVERENYGFTNAKTTYPFEDVGGTSIQSFYNNQNYYLHGLETIQVVYQNDAAQISLREIDTAYEDPDPAKDPNTQPKRTGSIFPAPVSTATFINETGPTNKANYKLQTFDLKGNLTDVVDLGDDAGADAFNYHIDYATPVASITVPSAITMRAGTTATGALLGKRTVTTFTTQGRPNGITDVIVGGRNPDATGTLRTAASPATDTSATRTFTYDGFGNVLTATSPNNTTTGDPHGDGSARMVSYTYEPTTQTYPLTTSWSDGTANPITASATYDLRFGVPKTITDVAGAKQEIVYDDYARITQVFAPSEFDANGNRLTTATPTIEVTYSEMPHNGTGFVESLPAYAMATHRSKAPVEGSLPSDALPNPLRAMRTVNFVDGLGRTIQVKKDITRDDGTTATASMSVSGQTVFDARGRVYRQGHPIFASAATPTAFVPVSMFFATEFAYDVLGRLRKEQHSQDGTMATTAISYSVAQLPTDGRTYIVKTTTDPLYASNNTYHWVNEYQNTRGETIVRQEPNRINNTATTITTSYGYDQRGQVIRVIDGVDGSPGTHVTTAEYDTVGNLVAVTSPDAGRREWWYCLGGYVCGEQSPNARATSNSTRIKYTYDRDRLMAITYPNSSTNLGVSYVYGTAATADKGTAGFYKTGRVKTRTDEAGQFEYQYDALGNVASEKATLRNQMSSATLACPAPFTSSQKCYAPLTTTYLWDNFGRLIDVTIPNTTTTTPAVNTAETIRYGYDAGGAVTSARGRLTASPNTTFHYVKHVGYNEYGERVRITYGNDVFSTYSYAADTRRLTTADTTILVAGQPTRTQALVYAYDLLGNVTSRTQSLPLDPSTTNPPVPIAGTSNLSFTYDPLNQLVTANLRSQSKTSERFVASNFIRYDAIGNITSKGQGDYLEGLDPMGNLIASDPRSSNTNYVLTPSYEGRPHAPISISESRLGITATRDLAYDADGNVKSSLINGFGRYITWTDTDRVRSICQGTQSNCNPTPATPLAKALYAADGTRTQNMVTQGTSTTETLYVNQFLTVRNGALPTKHVYIGDARVASKLESSTTVNNRYWYHSDNLQSTQFVTTTGQAVVQHTGVLPVRRDLARRERRDADRRRSPTRRPSRARRWTPPGTTTWAPATTSRRRRCGCRRTRSSRATCGVRRTVGCSIRATSGSIRMHGTTRS